MELEKLSNELAALISRVRISLNSPAVEQLGSPSLCSALSPLLVELKQAEEAVIEQLRACQEEWRVAYKEIYDVKSVLIEILIDERLYKRATEEGLLPLVIESITRNPPGKLSDDEVKSIVDGILLAEFYASLGPDSEPRWGNYDALAASLELSHSKQSR